MIFVVADAMRSDFECLIDFSTVGVVRAKQWASFFELRPALAIRDVPEAVSPSTIKPQCQIHKQTVFGGQLLTVSSNNAGTEIESGEWKP